MKFLPRRKSSLVILGIIILLLLLNIGSYLHLLYYDLEPESFFFRKLNFDSERNLPTIFSGILHFTASYLLGTIGISRLIINNKKWFWAVLSFLFFFLGVDEILSIHEKVSGNIKALEEMGTFLYNWVVVYSLGTLILASVILKPLLSLPRRIYYRFILAGIIFIFGAIVLESIAVNFVFQRELASENVTTEPIIFVLATFEELFEMLGVALFIDTLLYFLEKYKKRENHIIKHKE